LRTHYDAVIVGGGHNGLVAAAYLAHAGQSVLLLERDSELGGATRSKAIFPGMDARISQYAYLVGLFPSKIVRDLGLRFHCRRRKIASCTTYCRGLELGVLLLSNVDEAQSRTSLLRLTDAEDLRGYDHLLSMERAFAQRVWPSLLQPLVSRQVWKESMATPLERQAWEAFVERPLGETIEAHVRNDVLRGAIFTDGKIGVFTHAHDPSLLQNRCFILHVIGGGTGEWRVPVGGMGALVDALADAARAGGAELVTRAQVEAIQPQPTSHGLTFRLNDAERAVEATRVLVNAGPHTLARLLGTRYVAGSHDEGSVCKVNMLLRRLPRLRAGVDSREAFAGTFRVGESYGQMRQSFQQADAGEIPRRLPFETYCHTLTDPSILGPDLRGAGYQTLTLFGLDMPYRLFEADNETAKSMVLERCLRGLDDVLADPIEDCLAVDAAGEACIEIKSPIDLEKELDLNRGNIFHGELSWFFADGDDPAVSWGVGTPYDRIYRCGSSASRGGAVSGVAGHAAARYIFEEIGI
jgi:phytoene dehydrogenase-like protein